MRKTTRKLLSLLLAMAMILSVFSGVTFGSSISAQAAENPLPPEETLLGDRHEDSQLNYGSFVSGDYSYEILPDGTCAITGYNGNETNLTIPSVIDGYSVTKIDGAAFRDEFSLTGIIIPEGVTSIGYSAFIGCERLKSISVPESVCFIGYHAFENCASLEYHVYGNAKYLGNETNPYIHLISTVDSSIESVTVHEQTKRICDFALYHCDRLVSVYIPKGVTSIGESAFYGCNSLTEVNIPNSVTSIGVQAFMSCDSLAEISIPDSITTISNSVFESCSSLKSITLPDSLTSIGNDAFYGCNSLIGITIPEGVISIGSRAFAWCRELVNLEIHPNNSAYTSVSSVLFSKDMRELIAAPAVSGTYSVPDGVISISEWAFVGCYSLNRITLPNSVTSIGDSAFGSCYSLEYYVYDNAKYLGNENNPYMHLISAVDTSVESVTVHEQTKYICPSAFEYCSVLATIYIPEGVISIGTSAFFGCESLQSITIPQGVTSIGNHMFNSCRSLNNIIIPDSVTSIGNQAFSFCDSLTQIVLPDSVTSVGDSAFRCCKSLTEIAIPDSVTFVGDSAFSYCESLTEIIIPDSVTSIGNSVFESCSSLKSITIPDSVTSIGDHAFSSCEGLIEIAIPDSVNSIGDRAFSWCDRLTEIILPDSITSLGEGAFYCCGCLTEIIIPNSITSIGDSVFDGCSSLKSITIPDSVTSIGDHAFYGCYSLSEVTIPNSITSIGAYAFYCCEDLKSITFLGGAPKIGSNCFEEVTAEAYTPCGVDAWSADHTLDYGGDISWQVSHIVSDYHITQKPTCTEEGIQEGVCSACGESDTKSVPTTGHIYEDGICTSCGESSSWHYDYRLLSDGTCEITEYWGNEDCLSIPSVIDGYLVTAIGNRAFMHDYSLQEVILPDGITSIGESAFYMCNRLTEIILPDSLTSIGNKTFCGCESLTEIILPDRITSIGDLAFSGCEGFIEITIPNGVTSIGDYAFSDCKSLTEMMIPESVISIGVGAFVACNKMVNLSVHPNNPAYTSVDSVLISKDTQVLMVAPAVSGTYTIPEGVSAIGDRAFENCDSLTGIILPNSVTSIGEYAFGDCDSLTEITIPNSVTFIGDGAFWACNRLSEITLPDSITFIGDAAFGDCDSLTEVIIPKSVTSIGEYAFYGCYDLTKITVPDSVTSIGRSAFFNCHSLNEIILPNSVNSIGASAFLDCRSLTEIIIPEGVTSIGVEAFSSCDELVNLEVHPNNPVYTAVDSVLFSKDMRVLIAAPTVTGTYTIPEGVTTIGEYAFDMCYDLTRITVPDSVTSIEGGAFAECCGLTEIILPNGITCIGDQAFAGCSGLTEVILPNGITCIGDQAFSGCSCLAKITIPDSVTFVGSYVFEGCDNLEYYVYDNAKYLGNEENPFVILISVVDSSVESVCIPGGVTVIGENAFQWCENLTEVILPDSLISIEDYAFGACDSLTEIILPDSLTFVGDEAFYFCNSLTSIILPDSLTSIGASAFQCCYSLTEVTIPAGVTSIGGGAFAQCDELENLTVHPDNPAYTAVDSVLFSKDMEALIVAPSVSGTYAIPEGVTTIADNAFYNCHMLEGVVIPSSVTSIGNNTFLECYMDAVTFLGDAPQFADNSFQNTTTTAYYPAGNSTWTEDKLQNYDGSILWMPCAVSQVQVTFKDWDGTVLDSQTVAYGQMPVAPADPVRSSDSDQYHYYFTGWDKEVTSATEDVTYTAVYELITIPTLTLKAPTLEFKDMIKVVAFFTAENIEDVSYMGMLTYDQPVDKVDIWTADHVTYGAEYEESSGRYFASSQGIAAKYLGDTVYLAIYAVLHDGTYVYSRLASYSPITYATNQLKNSTDVKLKQLCVAMLNYSTEAQLFFEYNTDALVNAVLTDEQKALPEAYRADMVSSAPAVDAAKQGAFASNKGFSKRYPAISFEGAFCINYFFTPSYLPEGGITLYYWTEEDYNAADVLTAENASGAWISYRDRIEQYRFDINGIAAKNLSEAVYVAAVYSDGTTQWTSGVLSYSIGAYCASQISKGAAVAALAEATAVYGYHAKAFFD